MACSIEKEKKFVPRKARLKVIYRYPFEDITVICRQCNFAPCANQCPEKAIQRNDQTGAWEVDPNKCKGCGTCVKACPFKVINLSLDNNISVKCDLCKGNPQCVRWCPTGALSFEPRERLGSKRREDFTKNYVAILKNQRYARS